MKNNKGINKTSKTGNRTLPALIAICTIITFVAYFPSLKNNFTNWDDPKYVIANPDIQKISIENTKTLFSQYYMSNYHPVAMFSLALDFSIGKLNPKYYHVTNLVIHLANTALVFILIFLLFSKAEIAFITAALFGVHTLHVESVAWISERKDVLYTLFFLSSLIFYVRFIKEDNRRFYFFSILLFILSCLSKGMAVSLSLSLIAIDYFLQRNFRNRKVIIEKIPFFIISIVFGIIAINAQPIGDRGGIQVYNFFERLIIAAYGFTEYILKLIMPVNLSAFYPYPVGNSAPPIFWIYLLMTLAITELAVYSATKSRKYFFCFLFFAFNIVMVLQILPVGKAIMADRYAYVPSIGFFLALAIGFNQLKLQKTLLTFAGIAYIIMLITLTNQRCKIWNNSLTLWTDVIEKYPQAGIAFSNRGTIYAEQEKWQLALEDYNKAIADDSVYMHAYNNRGIARATLKDFAGAMEDYNAAIKLKSDYYEAFYCRGNLYLDLHDTVNAMKDYSAALKINPYHTGTLNNRGLLKRALKDYNGAMEDFNLSIKANPSNAEAYVNRALLKADMGDNTGAEQDNEKALELNPSYGYGHMQRGNARLFKKDYQGALSEYNLAIRFDPKNAEAYYQRGLVKINLNQPAGAIDDFSKAIALKSNDAKFYFQRGVVRSSLKQNDVAILDYGKAIEINPGYAEAFTNRGIIKYNTGDFEGALKDYDKSIELKQDIPEAYNNRGLLKEDMKNHRSAMEDFNKAIDLSPSFGLAFKNRGVSKYNLKDYKGACLDWKRGIELGNVEAKEFMKKYCK
jgi:protein O-mannosyl-transferase